jgi:hypothetical protein
MSVVKGLVATLFLFALGCSGFEPDTHISSRGQIVQNVGTIKQRQSAFRKASLVLLNRAPSLHEIESVQSTADYIAAMEAILSSESFLHTMRTYHQQYFELDGSEDGVNYNEPANLATQLISANDDFRKIVTADYCIDDTLNKVACTAFSSLEEQSQNAAGVLTTQAFLKEFSGPFNFKRVKHFFKAFACKEYPDVSDPGLPEAMISESIKPFASESGGIHCYSCHKSMNSRASLFYQFNINGQFDLNPSIELSTKTDTGSVSTIADLLEAEAVPEFRGLPVDKVQDLAKEFVNHSDFADCLSKRFINFLRSQDAGAELSAEDKAAQSLLESNQFRIRDFLFSYLTSGAYVED